MPIISSLSLLRIFSKLFPNKYSKVDLKSNLSNYVVKFLFREQSSNPFYNISSAII